MKKWLICIVAIVMMAIPAFADEAELLARIEALEQRVAILESQIGAKPENVSAVENAEPGELENVETGMVAGGSSLSYKRAELSQDYSGKQAVVLYFDYTNESGKTSSAGFDFYVKIFQNGREMESASVYDNQAISDSYTEFRSGAATVEVAFAKELQDTSDIIVNISSMRDWNVEDVEFTVSLE